MRGEIGLVPTEPLGHGDLEQTGIAQSLNVRLGNSAVLLCLHSVTRQQIKQRFCTIRK
ncbi:hypothetical protein [Gordonia terrae]|uniref:hypothetical protein n=1 Tax=Gordonia terrae TaxID=2055 RepID=UPI003F6C4A6D